MQQPHPIPVESQVARLWSRCESRSKRENGQPERRGHISLFELSPLDAHPSCIQWPRNLVAYPIRSRQLKITSKLSAHEVNPVREDDNYYVSKYLTNSTFVIFDAITPRHSLGRRPV